LAASVAQWYVIRQQLQIGNAASVSFTGMTLEYFGGTTLEGDPYWTFIPHVENSGSTATQNLVLKTYFDFAQGMSNDPDAWERTVNNFVPTQNISVGPHVPIRGTSVEINGLFLNEMVAKTSSAYFMGDGTYNDIFGQPHRTQWCVRVSVPTRNYSHGTTRTLSVTSIQCPSHNCIDAECELYRARPYRKLVR
jgi:hypothetical protein